MIDFFESDGSFRLQLFDRSLLSATNNLNAVLELAQQIRSAQIETTHFLIALSRIEGGFTENYFHQLGLAPTDLYDGLVPLAQKGLARTHKLLRDDLHPSSMGMVEILSDYIQNPGAIIDERVLLSAVIQNLTPPVLKAFEQNRITLPPILLSGKVDPFDEDGVLIQAAFTRAAWHVLELTQTEAEALGYDQIDPRHLLLGLLALEGGATFDALFRQDVIPRKVQEQVIINLRGRARQTRSELNLEKFYMAGSLVDIITVAAKEAAGDGLVVIAEAHLFRAFLQSETFALQMLCDSGLDMSASLTAARKFRLEDEPQPGTSADFLPWNELQAELENSLVGQQHVVGVCIPYLRRMVFDFRSEQRPVGVFLFCGPSGSGKTQLAKAMAKSIFGSEDNLLMLEMGQFQTKESMNIFIGAPPGYIGYGQGKLTNGLRDKPRSVVLFDEVEKAHKEVFNALLRFLDEGRIDDPAGPIRDGTNCIIILTSNVYTKGLEALLQENLYSKSKWEIRRKLRDELLVAKLASEPGRDPERAFQFLPEFLNRIDEIVLFRKLSADDLTNIARNYILKEMAKFREKKKIELVFETAALNRASRRIGNFCATLDEGARPVFRVVRSAIIDPVIDYLTQEDFPSGPPAILSIDMPGGNSNEEPRAEIIPILRR